MPTVVHVTHEAVQKIGGIGAVLEGLLTAPTYRSRVPRTVVVGPLFSRKGGVDQRLGPAGVVRYSSIDGRADHPAADALRQVEQRFGVSIVYGTRLYAAPEAGAQAEAEVLLIDVHQIAPHENNALKWRLFQHYGLRSDPFESIWEYEQYVRLAAPAIAALMALGIGALHDPAIVFAHEFMGLPTALAARLEPRFACRTLFHAHEVATVRKIVEDHPGHDTMFYNVMAQARAAGQSLADLFRDARGYFKHVLVEAARHCDGILAVGPQVVDELRFLGPAFDAAPIRLAYNGIPARAATVDEVAAARGRLAAYCQNLLGWRPDHVFTHVARFVRSKGLWRDLMVLRELDELMWAERRTAVFLILSNEHYGPRRPEEVRHMERWWRWPAAHREGYPDLTGGEALFYALVQEFNAAARAVKAIFINQFGFSREACGERVPAEVDFWDLRRGSDLEFGQSIYEPFGIAQVEAVSFGALCVFSGVCGCAGFVQDVASAETRENLVIADYTDLPAARDIPALLAMKMDEREANDRRVARGVAREIARLLPRSADARAAAVHRGVELAQRMSWEVVARDYVFPAIDAALKRVEVVAVG
ncbi:MAG: hypothetical protein U1A27_13300 [Phycisphaerae bacterium]